MTIAADLVAQRLLGYRRRIAMRLIATIGTHGNMLFDKPVLVAGDKRKLRELVAWVEDYDRASMA